MHVNYWIPWDTHDVNTLSVIVEALILWGVTFYGIKASPTSQRTNESYVQILYLWAHSLTEFVFLLRPKK